MYPFVFYCIAHICSCCVHARTRTHTHHSSVRQWTKCGPESLLFAARSVTCRIPGLHVAKKRRENSVSTKHFNCKTYFVPILDIFLSFFLSFFVKIRKTLYELQAVYSYQNMKNCFHLAHCLFTPLFTCKKREQRIYRNPLKTKRRPLYLKTQSVPRCKHFSSRL